MRLAMNRFLLIEKLKPEFKMVQPLPAFLGVPTAVRSSGDASETATLDLKRRELPGILPPANSKSFTTAGRNMTS